jgi:hypothetical protein
VIENMIIRSARDSDLESIRALFKVSVDRYRRSFPFQGPYRRSGTALFKHINGHAQWLSGLIYKFVRTSPRWRRLLLPWRDMFSVRGQPHVNQWISGTGNTMRVLLEPLMVCMRGMMRKKPLPVYAC